MANKPIEGWLKQEPLALEIAQLIKGLRQHKNLSQEEICEEVELSRQRLSEIENGHLKRLDLDKVQAIVNACGEQLYVTSSYDNPLQISDQTEQEDQILLAFSEGRIEEAEEGLAQIRYWRYPTTHMVAKCKLHVALAISYHFKQLQDRSQMQMNKLLMGLSLMDCREEADRFDEMYARIIECGEKQVSKQSALRQKEGELI